MLWGFRVLRSTYIGFKAVSGLASFFVCSALRVKLVGLPTSLEDRCRPKAGEGNSYCYTLKL